jgi:hypothetical protein
MNHLPYFRLLDWALLLGTLVLAGSGCTKEKVNCGHGHTTFRLQLRIVDNRTGLDWFGALSAGALDSLQRLNTATPPSRVGTQLQWGPYYLDQGADQLPDAGGDLTNRYLLRLSPTDTDTVDATAHFGPLNKGACDAHHPLEVVELHYNGRLNGRYGAGNGLSDANFTCSGCESVLVFRKQR